MNVIVKPHSGLANRIRVMVSAISLGKRIGCDVKIVWEREKGLNCNFYDLFQRHPALHIVQRSMRTDILDKVRAKPVLVATISKLLGIGFIMYDVNMREYVWCAPNGVIDVSKFDQLNKDIYIKACNDFYFQGENLQYFMPSDLIQAKINANTKHFTNNTVGIHIRRGDHQTSIYESPTEYFKLKMRDEVAYNKQVSFYVATDDPHVKEELITEFGERVYYANAVLSRNTVEGMTDAMVDLYSLSRTCKIYGSYWSSYSDIAAKIGNIPLEIIQKNNQSI
ncbi:hypothetical protein [Lacibacter sp. H407]|uniref:hypothetical protein n=1 Tax=Lacibacter sp. H407 TaxID=3133423 RepID=UPI0030BFADFE